jgi:hypothetical protein
MQSESSGIGRSQEKEKGLAGQPRGSSSVVVSSIAS